MQRTLFAPQVSMEDELEDDTDTRLEETLENDELFPYVVTHCQCPLTHCGCARRLQLTVSGSVVHVVGRFHVVDMDEDDEDIGV